MQGGLARQARVRLSRCLGFGHGRTTAERGFSDFHVACFWPGTSLERGETEDAKDAQQGKIKVGSKMRV
jgi:hypothetical protein